jgi:predicted acyl esterase
MNCIYERNVPMTTRDGVTLLADVWRPAEGRPNPADAHALQQRHADAAGWPYQPVSFSAGARAVVPVHGRDQLWRTL